MSEQEQAKAKEAIMVHVRKVVPYALFTAVLSGMYMFVEVFGEISPAGMNSFQITLSIKAFLGLWLGLRGFNQKLFGIDPWLFKSHRFPFIVVLVMIFLSQAIYF